MYHYYAFERLYKAATSHLVQREYFTRCDVAAPIETGEYCSIIHYKIELFVVIYNRIYPVSKVRELEEQGQPKNFNCRPIFSRFIPAIYVVG